jgi:hypothetical protein
MKLEIDLTVDVAFKKVFGNDLNAPVLINLLHAVVQPAQPITGVEIAQAQSEKETPLDKLAIGDVRERPGTGPGQSATQSGRASDPSSNGGVENVHARRTGTRTVRGPSQVSAGPEQPAPRCTRSSSNSSGPTENEPK